MKKQMTAREKKQRAEYRKLSLRIVSCDYTLSMAQVRRYQDLDAKFSNRKAYS